MSEADGGFGGSCLKHSTNKVGTNAYIYTALQTISFTVCA